MCSSCTSINGREIAKDGGRPHVDLDAKALTYADVFPNRVAPWPLYIVRALMPEWAKDPFARLDVPDSREMRDVRKAA